MGKFLKILFSIILKICVFLTITGGVLFAVYYWDLDKKVLGWLQTMVKTGSLIQKKKNNLNESPV